MTPETVCAQTSKHPQQKRSCTASNLNPQRKCGAAGHRDFIGVEIQVAGPGVKGLAARICARPRLLNRSAAAGGAATSRRWAQGGGRAARRRSPHPPAPPPNEGSPARRRRWRRKARGGEGGGRGAREVPGPCAAQSDGKTEASARAPTPPLRRPAMACWLRRTRIELDEVARKLAHPRANAASVGHTLRPNSRQLFSNLAQFRSPAGSVAKLGSLSLEIFCA